MHGSYLKKTTLKDEKVIDKLNEMIEANNEKIEDLQAWIDYYTNKLSDIANEISSTKEKIRNYELCNELALEKIESMQDKSKCHKKDCH